MDLLVYPGQGNIVTMSQYRNHLEQMYDKSTFKRKVDYLKYNLGYLVHDLSKGATILEVGPGMGELVYYLNRIGVYEIDIVDNDKAILENIKSKYRIKNPYLNQNLSQIDNKLRQYDIIVLIQVFEHLPINIYKDILTTLYKHLKVGGSLIIVVPNANNPLGMVERYGDLQHFNSFTEQSLKDLLNLAGFRNFEFQIKGFEIPPFDLLNIIRIILQKILHTILLVLMIINGGIFFKTMTPNIMLIIRKNR